MIDLKSEKWNKTVADIAPMISKSDPAEGASMLNDLYTAAKAAHILNDPQTILRVIVLVCDNANLTASKGASIFDDGNLSVAKASDIYGDTNLSMSRIQDISTDANITDKKAQDIIHNTDWVGRGEGLKSKDLASAARVGAVCEISEEKADLRAFQIAS